MHFTLNLLPPKKQQDLHAGIIFSTSAAILTVFLILVVIFAMTLISLRFVLKGVQSDLATLTEQLSSESRSPRTEIKEIDDYLTSVDLLQQQSIRWSSVFSKIAEATPKGVRLAEMNVTTKGSVFLRGVAPTRDEVLRFKNSLEASGLFSEVSSPLSNILQQTDVQFSFEATYPPLVALGL